ncbi:hypothetical protein HDU86_007882 [Geranomyces michiganensis]|nr:hypothetical protein HDU86_007882 [Geranomyces michiganensis]
MTAKSLDACCLRAIVIRLAKFDLFVSVIFTVFASIFKWEAGLLNGIGIALTLFNLWILNKVVAAFWTLSSAAGMALTVYRKLKTSAENNCFDSDDARYCEHAEYPFELFMLYSMYILGIMTGFAIYYAKCVSKYATLLREAPEFVRMEDGLGFYTLVDQDAKDAVNS